MKRLNQKFNGTLTDRKFLHEMCQKFYANKKERSLCLGCGKKRLLGKRGQAKIYCRRCRRERRVSSSCLGQTKTVK